MSGILGTYNLDGRPVDGLDLHAIGGATAHRGPDGERYWQGGPVGFGHQMLCTTPESLHESLPLVSGDATLIVTSDARIDNRDELIKQTQPLKRSDRPVTDAELILAAYRKWGVRCPEHLLGDFAFAIWDVSQQRLVCARDPFGVRPFYYHHIPGRRFAFASEAKGLLALSDVSSELNDLEMGRQLLLPLPSDASATSYREILALEPAHCMVVDRSGIRSNRYWDFDPDHEITLSSDAEYAEAFRELFFDSVRARVRSAYPVLTMLSGGMDSSSITCTAAMIGRERAGQTCHTFSAVFEDVPESDERQFISAVLRDYDELRPHYLYADRESPMNDRVLISSCQESPSFGNAHINWNGYRAAKASGARVVLDGFDGDNVVSHGLGYFSQLAREKRFLNLALEVRAYAITKGQPWQPAVRAWLESYLAVPLRRRLGLGRIRALLQPKTATSKVAAPDDRPWAEGLSRHFADQVAPFIHYAPAPRTQREEQVEALRKAANDHICETQNKSAAHWGVEPTFPFLDRRLVEFCLALPPQQKIRRGRTRIVLRNAMAGILPEVVRNRPFKSNLEPGFHHGIRKFSMDAVRGVVHGEYPTADRYVDPEYLKSTHAKFVAQEESKAERQLLLNSVALRVWLKHAATLESVPSMARFGAKAI